MTNPLTRISRRLLILTFWTAAAAAQAQQAGPGAMEAKLKEALKTTTTQLRTMQTERDTALAEKTVLETELKKLKADLDTRIKDEEIAKQKAQKEIEDLTAKQTETQKSLDQHKASLAQWMEGFKKMEALRNSTEAKRSSLASQVVQMQRRIDDQQAKNREMYKLACEILARYENFGLGRALVAREPFTGLAKVKLQTYVQDFADKLADQQIFPATTPGGDPKPAPPAKPATPATPPAEGTKAAPPPAGTKPTKS